MFFWPHKLRDELRALLTLKALAKARRALAKGLVACVLFSLTPPPPQKKE
jgi:hypothetical protein